MERNNRFELTEKIVMEEIHLMFKNGKYETIIDKLTELSTTKNGLLEQLSGQNNITVCEYLKVSYNIQG